MTKAVVLGGGMVGAAAAVDLKENVGFDVTIADVRAELPFAKAHGIAWTQADLSDPARLRAAVQPFDVVVGALSSSLGLRTLRAVIEAGKTYCDISFMADDALSLGELARARGVTAIVDCGVGPGMSNLLAAHSVKRLQPCESLAIYVGGLPVVRRWPFEYKVGFSPSDVIEEYTRPARLVENGRLVVKEPLSEPELLDFAEIGTLEAFNTDGLRSLAHTLHVPNMKEKTIRYPGHAELMRVFRDTGLFGTEPIEIGGQRVAPLDVTSRLLFPKWTYAEGEEDLTVLRIVAEGSLGGQRTRITWEMLDRYDPVSRLRSMSRTTAFPASIVAGLLATGTFARPGVHAPEVLAEDDALVARILAEHARRGIVYRERVEKLAPSD